MFKRKKVGLALSGGGARGFAHIGVLKVFEKNKIPIDFISGTSMGALIGAMYSAQPNIKRLEKQLSHKDWKMFYDYSIVPNKGLIKGDKIEAWLSEHLGKIDFKELSIPLYVTSFDLKNKQEVIFSKGDVAKAVRASISIPGVFVPVENNGRVLVVGGIIDPIPTEVLVKLGADIIIAVNVNATKDRSLAMDETAVRANNVSKIPNIFNSTETSIRIMEAKLTDEDSIGEEIDLAINVSLEDVETFDFGKYKKIVLGGERAANEKLSEIRKLMKKSYLKSFVEKLSKETGVKDIVEPIKDIGKEVGDIIE